MKKNGQMVHVRISEAGTGKPTPCRVRFTDDQGNYFAPLGSTVVFATGPNQDVGGKVLLGMKPHAYINGAWEIALPPGPLRVELSKGPEFLSRTVDVQLVPGKLALRLDIERWIDMRTQGWYSGDTRVHFLAPHAALLEAQAEDVAVVNLLARECQVQGPFQKSFVAVPNLLAFSGQSPCLETPGYMVIVGTLNQHPELGSLALLNSHRVVYPLSFGGPQGQEDWTLAAWCDQCHRKGGLVVWAHTLHESRDFLHGEPLADLILGKVDAFEIDFFEDSPFDVLPTWYTLLNAGLAVPLAGASGKDSNGVPLGAMRTYARLLEGTEFSYKSWIEAVRAGRTFITNGPLLTLTVHDQDPGTTLNLEEKTMVRIRAEARSQVPFQSLEILCNGQVIATSQGAGQPCAALLEMDFPVEQGGWLAARCRGDQQLLQQPANQRVFAHTSPVYLHLKGPRRWTDPAAREGLVKELQAMAEWARTTARCDSAGQRENLSAIFEEAIQLLTKARSASKG